MTTGEAIKLLIDNGFKELNQVGSHRKFGKTVGTEILRITIVYHKSDKESIHKKAEKQIKNLLNQSNNAKT